MSEELELELDLEPSSEYSGRLGAGWLPFRRFGRLQNGRNEPTVEAIWTNVDVDEQLELFTQEAP